MQNRTPSARPALDFEPVPRKYRYDGWTAERQRAFIAALAETGSVKAAAKRINMSTEGAYYLRRQPAAESFAAAWNAALDHGVQCLTDIAIDRAIEGVPVPIYWHGEQVGEKRRYNDRLLMFILRHHMADRYGATGIGGATRSHGKSEQAAQVCPACEAQAAAANPDEDERKAAAQALAKLLKRYAAKVAYERQHRLAGDIVAADLAARQLAYLEVMLTVPCDSPALNERWYDTLDGVHRAFSADKTPTYSTELCEHLGQIRRDAWAREADLRPATSSEAGTQSSGIGSGPTITDRHAARREAESQHAAAQAMWEATASEETWAAWLAGEGAYESKNEKYT